MFKKVFTTIVVAAALICEVSAAEAAKTAAKPAAFNKSALIICSKQYYTGWLVYKFKNTGLKLTHFEKPIKGKTWQETGYALPPLSELKKYDLVFTQLPFTAAAKKDFVEYVKGGGTILMTYTSMTLMKEKTGELAFGIAGFDAFQALHKVPYTQKDKLTHKVKYTKAMGKEKAFSFSTVYTIGVRDLMDAVPLIVFDDKSGLVNTCYAKVGKGYFIYSGFEDLDAISDVLRVLGLAKK